MPTGPFALTENGDIWVVDANDDLIRRDSGGVRVMQHLAHPVKRIESDGDLLLLLTTGTHGVVALHSRGSAVEEAWQVTLPSLGGDILHTAGRVLVSLPNEDRVLVLDATTGASMGSIAVPAGPWSLARRDNIVLLGSLTEPSVSELNPTTMVVQSVTRIDVSPQELLVGDGVVLTASIGDEAISAYSEPDLRLLRRIELPQSNSQVAVIGTTLLAATYGRRPELVAVDTRDLTVRWRVAVPSEAYQIAGHGNAFYADMTEDGALVRLPV
jgi:hypothetical protein